MNTGYFSRPEEAVFAPLVHELADVLMARKGMLITAESCTGGLVAALCTNRAGSSAWLKGGIVAYSNDIKQRLLAVPGTVLEEHGAVSEQTVTAMAIGALAYTGGMEDGGQGGCCGASLAISGVAGPGGGSESKPVGTVWIGWAVLDGQAGGACSPVHGSSRTKAERYFFSGNREQIRLAAAREALRGMIEFLR